MAAATQPKRNLMRVQEKGQVTLPADIRRRLGLKKGDLVSMTPIEGGVLIKPVTVKEQTGSPWLRELYEYFAPVRAEAIEKGYTEDEINADIDQALAEVRARHA